jgi:HSP20 family protein
LKTFGSAHIGAQVDHRLHQKGGAIMFGNAGALETLLDEVRRLDRGVDQWFGQRNDRQSIRSVARGTFPPVNVGVTEDEVHVYLFAPGLDAAAFDVSVQQNLLSVSGARALPLNEKATYFRQERFDGEFRRVITLPEDVDPGRIEARYRDGVLQISIHRRETAKARQIKVG